MSLFRSTRRGRGEAETKMLYLLRNKKTKQFLRVHPEIREQHNYYEEGVERNAYLQLSDLGWGPIYSTDNIDDINDLLETGESSHVNTKVCSDYGEKFELSDLELVTLEPT